MTRLLIIALSAVLFICRDQIGRFIIDHDPFSANHKWKRSSATDKPHSVTYSGMLQPPGALNIIAILFPDPYIKTEYDIAEMITDTAVIRLREKANRWLVFDPESAGHAEQSIRIIRSDDFLQALTRSMTADREYFIELFTDIPIDSDEFQLIDPSKPYAGHSFIQLSSCANGDTLRRTFGLYPQYPWEAVVAQQPVPAILVDNEGHEYNASIKRKITREDLIRTLAFVGSNPATKEYDLQNHNCTDFAIYAYNTAVRSDQLKIEKIQLGIITLITPGCLYSALQRLKQDSSNPSQIEIAVKKRAGR